MRKYTCATRQVEDVGIKDLAIMREKIKIMGLALLFFLGIKGFAQEPLADYNPFVTENLDDPAKLAEVPVVESSYHYYNVVGDPNYSEASTFVWYVENGTLGYYDSATDTWTPITVDGNISNGQYAELTGVSDGTNPNTSSIWVRWNDGSGGSIGYIAVYERSADNCVFDQQITGFKHLILVPPEVWFVVGERQECSDQLYSVTAQFNELNTISYPYTLTYTYPEEGGALVQVDTTIYETDLDASLQMHWDLPGVQDRNVALDEQYTISLDELRDRFGSMGKIAPLGESSGQYAEMTITITHLPQTGPMNMF